MLNKMHPFIVNFVKVEYTNDRFVLVDNTIYYLIEMYPS